MGVSGLQAKWMSWDFLKPEGLANPLPVVVTLVVIHILSDDVVAAPIV
jgi:hypothetical protein